MSALDQAFIKAYAKDNSASTTRDDRSRSVGTVEGSHSPRTLPKQATTSPMIDQIYADGALYRLEAAVSGGSGVPAPHFDTDRTLPRTTARRLARRAAPEIAPQMEVPPEPQPTSRPPRRHWSRSVVEVARRLALDPAAEEMAELAPEIVIQPGPKAPEPSPVTQSPVTHPSPEPWLPPSPANLVVNATWDADHADWTNTSVALVSELCDWQQAAELPQVATDLQAVPQPESQQAPAQPTSNALASDASVSSPAARQAELPPDVLSHELCAPVLTKRTNSKRLPPAAPVTTAVSAAPTVTTAAATKSFRLDAPHALAEKHLHRKPEAPPAAPLQEQAVPVVEVAPPPAPELPSVAELATVATEAPPAEAIPAPECLVSKKPCVPLWEVDRFLWPETCERLLRDDESYFAQAGEKLQAALRDGLKTLAITGSRRGEGRSTLALCLARAAAQAGVQVALVDADFARPQLANMIGLEVAYSWQDAATGKIPLSEAAIKSLADKVTVLPLEGAAAGSPLTLADPRVTATLRALAATFELLILDLGPMSPGAEPLFPVDEPCPIDAAVVVRDLRYASLPETQAIGERLHGAGIDAVGVAENFVSQ